MADVGDNRAQFFASLQRRSPSPQPHQQQQQQRAHAQMHSKQNDGAAAAQYQMAYLQLQQQMLMQQSQLLLATAAQQAMLGQGCAPIPQQQYAPDQHNTLHPEEDLSRNPLAASAMARRKRQSLTLESPAASFTTRDHGRRVSSGGHSLTSQQHSNHHQLLNQQPQHHHQAGHHRRTSSGPVLAGHGLAHEPRRTWSSSTAATTLGDTPPALVLSKPGDPFLPPSPPASDEGAPSVSSWLSDVEQASLSFESGVRRPSQAGSLAAALGRRKTSLNIDVPSSNATSAALSSSLSATAPSFQSQLSPFATTFQPLPPSPYTPSPAMTAMYGGGTTTPTLTTPRLPTPPRTGGTGVAVATATRQPRGPASEAEFTASNFAARLRKHAVACLVGRGGGGATVRVSVA